MSYFELKPQTELNPFSKNIDSLLFTYPRDQVPPQLASRGVDHSTWTKTWDGVASIYEMALGATKAEALASFSLSSTAMMSF